MIQQAQLQLKKKGEQILCQFHKQPTIQLNIGKNVKLGERLICEECNTIQYHVLLLNQAEIHLYNMYQEEKKTIQQHYLKSEEICNQQNAEIDKIKKSLSAIFNTLQENAEKLITALTQQVQINKERLNSLIDQNSKTKLSQLLENIANSEKLSDQTLQQTAEFISNQSIVNGKLELKDKVQISDSSIKSIQESNDRISAFLNSFKVLLDQGNGLNVIQELKIVQIQNQKYQQKLQEYQQKLQEYQQKLQEQQQKLQEQEQKLQEYQLKLQEQQQKLQEQQQKLQEQQQKLQEYQQKLQEQQQILLDYDKFNYKQPIQLEGHNDYIRAVAMSSSEQVMASGDWKGLIILWELDSKSIKLKYNGEVQIQDLIFSPDDKLLAAAQFGSPYDIIIFNLCTPSQTSPYMRLKGHSDSVWRIVFTLNSKFMISGSGDKTLKIWSLDQQKCVFNQNLSSSVRGVNISQDQQYISACCWDGQDGQASLFNSTNIENPKEIAKWKAHKDYAYGTTFTPDSKMFLTCGNGDIKLWNITQLLSQDQQKSPLRVYKTENNDSRFWSVQTRLNGSMLISNDNKIRIWNMESGKLIQTLYVPEGYQYTFEYNFSVSKDMKYIIKGGKNKQLKVYELNIKQG